MNYESIKAGIEEKIGAKIDLIKTCGSEFFGLTSKHDTDILCLTNETVTTKHFSYEGYDVFIRDLEEQEKIKTLTYGHSYFIPIIATFDDETAEYMGWNPLEHKEEIIEYIRPLLKSSSFNGHFSGSEGNLTRQNKRMCYALAIMYKFKNDSLDLTEEQRQHVCNAHDKCVDETEIDKAEEFYGLKASINALSKEEQLELKAINSWFQSHDYYPNKIITGEWTTDNPKWLAYLEERQTKRKRYDELMARLE